MRIMGIIDFNWNMLVYKQYLPGTLHNWGLCKDLILKCALRRDRENRRQACLRLASCFSK